MLTTVMNGTIFGNRLDQWAHAAMFLAIGWVVAKLISWLGSTVLLKMAARTENQLDDELVRTMRRPVVVLITLVFLILGCQQLELPDTAQRWMERVFHVSIALAVTWAIVRAIDVMAGAMFEKRRVDGADRESEQFMPVVRASLKVLLWCLGVIVALNNAGYDVGALLAGIGIGGLALAMAAKDTLANIFGGITVFTDRPFQVGDRVRMGGHDGFVKEIGIRSTRIHTLEGPIVVVPNFKFTDSVLENISQEPSRRVRHELGLVYQTTPEELERALSILNELVDEHQEVLEQERLVCFTAFKEYALNILFIYYIRKDADIFATQSRIHLELLRRFAAAKLEFAYPTAVELQGEIPART